MPPQAPTVARLRKAGVGAFFRPRDVEPLGISFPDLQRFVAAGTVEKVAPGLYRLSAAEPDELETIAMVGSAVPAGIVCLLTALRIHGIGTQAPHEVWLALDRKARKPSRLPARVRIVRFSGAMLTYGVQVRRILGVPVHVTRGERGRDHARRRSLPRPYRRAHLPGGALAVTKRPLTNIAASVRDRDRLPGAPRNFFQVGERIKGFLAPPWTALAAGETFKDIWRAGGPWGKLP
jgi:hypothetical protein